MKTKNQFKTGDRFHFKSDVVINGFEISKESIGGVIQSHRGDGIHFSIDAIKDGRNVKYVNGFLPHYKTDLIKSIKLKEKN